MILLSRRFLGALLLAAWWMGSSLVWAHEPQVALVVIDMQDFFMKRYGTAHWSKNKSKTNRLIKSQQKLIHAARQRSLPIVVVEYDCVGPTCKRLARQLEGYAKARVFRKASDGLFDPVGDVARNVEEFLYAQRVSDLVVVGANGGACVESTIKQALERGYRVWVDERAVADFNSKHFVYPYRYSVQQLSLNREFLRFFEPRSGLGDWSEVFGAIEKDLGYPTGHRICPAQLMRHRDGEVRPDFEN